MSQKTPAARTISQDASFWSTSSVVQEEIGNRLGWLDAMAWSRDRLQTISNFVTVVDQRDFDTVLLIGMGGSLLAPEVFSRFLGSLPGYPTLITLDSTNPNQILAVTAKIDPGRTLVVVSSKSGETLETLSLYRYFLGVFRESTISDPGSHFVAITDPSSFLQREAAKVGFMDCFLNPPNIGGRFSALSFFGLIPAALVGVKIEAVLDGADQALKECAAGGGGALIGEWLANGWKQGRDKLGLVLPERLEAFGWWVEQLVAESLGKDGKGILPYFCDSTGVSARADEMRVMWTSRNADALEQARPWGRSERIVTEADLGKYLFNWEFAIAVAGGLMDLNPFDEPDVAAAKKNTTELLRKDDVLERLKSTASAQGLPEFLRSAESGDYVAVLAFLPYEEGDQIDRLADFRRVIEAATGIPVTLNFGPRYLHSAGQFHKGGPSNGLYLLVVDQGVPELAIPGAPYDFGTLLSAQALGDYEALRDRGRRVMIIDHRDIASLI
jgi:transaldolase/glucose-6-phosphate isomerase